MESTDSENIEVNVKDIKKFFEVATSPISTSPPQTWKSMPNLAKDMATQTTISYESSEEEEDGDDDDSDSDGQVQPMTSVGEHLLVPLEERKKAFIGHENSHQGIFLSL